MLGGLPYNASNVLHCAPSVDGTGSDVCRRLLSADDRSAVVGVTVTTTPDEWVRTHRLDVEGSPEIRIVNTGDNVRSTATDTTGGENRPGADITVSTVRHNGNLTKLGVALTESFEGLSPDGEKAIALCFDDVASLFHHADDTTVAKFFQVLTNLVAVNDAVAHYHVNPAAIGDQALNRVKISMDAVVSTPGDGDHTVQTRRGH